MTFLATYDDTGLDSRSAVTLAACSHRQVVICEDGVLLSPPPGLYVGGSHTFLPAPPTYKSGDDTGLDSRCLQKSIMSSHNPSHDSFAFDQYDDQCFIINFASLISSQLIANLMSSTSLNSFDLG